MLNDIDIYQSTNAKNNEEIQNISTNELIIDLPYEGFTVIVITPMYNIEEISPCQIRLKAINDYTYEVEIITPKANLKTIVSKLVIKILAQGKARIIKIVAPPKNLNIVNLICSLYGRQIK